MITYAAAFDPEALKFVALQMLDEAGVKIRLHSTFVDAVVHDGVVQGGVFETARLTRERVLPAWCQSVSGVGHHLPALQVPVVYYSNNYPTFSRNLRVTEVT